MVCIRSARLEDEAALRRVDRATWTADVSPAPSTGSSEPFFDGDACLDDVLVAEHEGLVVGYVRLDQPGPLPSHAHVLVVDGLAVAPDRQRQGIGLALVEAALAEAGRRGARKVALRVLAPNTRARGLYARCGFVLEGVLRQEFLLNGELVDDLLLARHLDQG